MPGETVYDTIGRGYADRRRPDPRIEAQLHAALGGAQRIINVGAGTGSYEPHDRAVVAVEPSLAMITQRPRNAAPAVRAVAESAPFPNASFDGAMALLSVHHWYDPAAGLRELRRVTNGPVVVFTFDHAVHSQQWLVADYLPDMVALDRGIPAPEEIVEMLGGGSVEIVFVPWNCTDGFCHAWWRRPAAYLEPSVRGAISGIVRLPTSYVAGAMFKLENDLTNGGWSDRHGDLLGRDRIDAGYRVVVSPGQ